MNYIKIATLEYPRYQGDIRLEYPEIGTEFCCPDSYAYVHETEVPITTQGQVLAEHLPVLVDGVWRRKFYVRDATAHELATVS